MLLQAEVPAAELHASRARYYAWKWLIMAHEQDLADNAPLLRYLSFAKFAAMLSSRSLHLCRLDRLGAKDSFEGSLPLGHREQLVQELIAEFESDPPAELVEARERWRGEGGRRAAWRAEAQVRAYTLALRSSTYVSCWSLGPESEAMWRLYSEGHEGVAMGTTLAKLRSSLADADVMIGPVRYIDYKRETLPGRDYIQQLVHKRIAFVHEREVRVLHRPQRRVEVPLPGEEPPAYAPDVYLPWNPEHALDRVIVSPFAPDWYPETVRAVVKAFAPALAGRLALSELGAEPVY